MVKSMKKISLIALIVALLFGAVALFISTHPDVIANLLEAKEKDDAEDKTPVITHGELSIELPSDFKRDVSMPTYSTYLGNDYRVHIERVDHSSITPNPGYSFPSLQEFMKFNMSILLKCEESDVHFTDINGITCVEADTNGDDQPDTLIAIFETEGAFWDVRFSSSTKDYTTSRDQYVAWAKTVTFSE